MVVFASHAASRVRRCSGFGEWCGIFLDRPLLSHTGCSTGLLARALIQCGSPSADSAGSLWPLSLRLWFRVVACVRRDCECGKGGKGLIGKIDGGGVGVGGGSGRLGNFEIYLLLFRACECLVAFRVRYCLLRHLPFLPIFVLSRLVCIAAGFDYGGHCALRWIFRGEA